MSGRTTVDFLTDARDHCIMLADRARDVAPGAFAVDEVRLQSAIYCVLVIGEAMNRVPKEVRTLVPEVAWEPAIAMRNRLVHAYWLADPEIVFRVAADDAPKLAGQLDRLILRLS